MKRYYKNLTRLGLILALCLNTSAASAKIFNLAYTSLGNNQYEFTLDYTYDACGVLPPSTLSIDINSSCGSQTLALQGGQILAMSPVCFSSPSTCCSGGGGLCFNKRLYTGIATLPPCSDWIISYSGCCNNWAILNIQFPTNTYTELRLNNIVAPNNSSVKFNSDAIITTTYAALNTPYTYRPFAYDLNCDSLVFTLIPLPASATSDYPWRSGYSLANPYGNNNFSINPHTGEISTTFNATGLFEAAINVAEYHNGVLVANTKRSFIIYVWNNVAQNPVAPIVTETNFNGCAVDNCTGALRLIACPGSTVSFNLNISSPSVAPSYEVSYNISNLPGSSLVLAGNNTTNVSGTFTWNTTGFNNGIYYFTVYAKNYPCDINYSFPKTYIIEIYSPPTLYDQIPICEGSPNIIQLEAVSQSSAVAGATYVWSPITGLDNPYIRNPVATVSSATNYSTTFTSINGCPQIKNIDFIRSIYTFNFPPQSDLVICPNGSVVLDSHLDQTISTFTYSNTSSQVIPHATNYLGTNTLIAIPVSGVLPTTISNAADLAVFNSVNFNISLPFMDYLVVTLISPSGQQVILSQNNGGIGSGYNNSTFAYPIAANAQLISNYANSPVPSNGNFIPQGGASAWNNLIGSTVNGNWVLKITHNNTLGQTDGLFQNATLRFNNIFPISYTWSPSNTLNNALLATPTASPTTTTTYQVIALNNSCVDTASITVNIQNTLSPPTLSSTFSTNNNTLTFNWHSTLAAVSYSVSTNGGQNFINIGADTSYTMTGLTPGQQVTLCVIANPTVISACSSSAQGCFSATAGTCPNLVPNIIDTLNICPNSSVSLSVSVNNGTSPYSFAWSNGTSGTQVIGLSVGTYQVTATDANGCTGVSSTTINSLTPPTISASTTPVTCFNGHDGSATINVSGGLAPYTYNWSTNATTTSINNLVANTYTVTVSDANTCSTSYSVSVSEADEIIATITNTPVTCAGGTDGSINLSTAGGTAPYSYIWNTTNTIPNLTGLSMGYYLVTITDAVGCTSVKATTLTEPTPLILNTSSHIACFGEATGSVDLQVSGGLSPYNFAWSNGLNTQNLNQVGAGNYTVTVSDTNNCISTITETVNQAAAALSIAISSTASNGNNGTASTTVMNGTPPYIYEWNTGETTSSITGLAPGLFTVLVTDTNGCADTISIFVDNVIGTNSIDDSLLAIDILPNPNNGLFLVNITGSPLDNAHIDISNLSGQVIRRIELPSNCTQIPIDLSSQAKGIYLLRLQAAELTIIKQLIIL